LTRHRDIQAWVAERHGQPAMVRAPNRFGEWRARLALRFERPVRPAGMPSIDQGASPVSWSAWLAELDRQQLALRVSEDGATDYEFVERKTLN
jgi:hypothetical protein